MKEAEAIKITCPNCGKLFDGVECLECGFDTFCYDPYWD